MAPADDLCTVKEGWMAATYETILETMEGFLYTVLNNSLRSIVICSSLILLLLRPVLSKINLSESLK